MNDDNDGLQCLESVADASRDHQAIDMQRMQWQWHPILQGTCYGNCQLIASLGVFPQLSAQHLLSLCHLRFTWTWVGSNAQGLRTCSTQEWCVVWCKSDRELGFFGPDMFWHVMVMEVVAGIPAPSSVEWSANCSRTGTWQRSTRVTSCHLGCLRSLPTALRHALLRGSASVQRRRSFLAPWTFMSISSCKRRKHLQNKISKILNLQ